MHVYPIKREIKYLVLVLVFALVLVLLFVSLYLFFLLEKRKMKKKRNYKILAVGAVNRHSRTQVTRPGKRRKAKESRNETI